MHAKSPQLCQTLGDLLECSPPGSSIHGVLQARILKWVGMPSSRGSSWPRNGTSVFCLLHWQAGSWPLAPPGKPHMCILYHFISGTWAMVDFGICGSWCLPLWYTSLDFPGGTSGKESAWQCRRSKRCDFDPWIGKIP